MRFQRASVLHDRFPVQSGTVFRKKIMNKFSATLGNIYRNSKARAATAGATLMVASSGAFAQDADPIGQFFDAIQLGGVSGKVVAAGLLVVGIALVFKGPVLAKRVVKMV